jgi:hypothetical protein
VHDVGCGLRADAAVAISGRAARPKPYCALEPAQRLDLASALWLVNWQFFHIGQGMLAGHDPQLLRRCLQECGSRSGVTAVGGLTEQDGRMVTGLQATGTDGRTEQELRRRLAHTLFIPAT